MAKVGEIMVDILIDGKPQPVFEDPNPQDTNKDKGNNFYVEVVGDARFEVKVSFCPDFELFDADGVLVYPRLDGRSRWNHFLDRQYLQSHRSTTISKHPNYNATARQWQDEAISFRKLHLRKHRKHLADNMLTRLFAVETIDMEGAPNTLQRLGQISVEVKRVKQQLLSEPESVKELEEKTVTQVSEKLLKGKAIENAIK
jgi:hypothetical protein